MSAKTDAAEIRRYSQELQACQSSNKINLDLITRMKRENADFRAQVLAQEGVIAEFKSQLLKQDILLVQLETKAVENQPRLEAVGRFMRDLEAIATGTKPAQAEQQQKKFIA